MILNGVDAFEDVCKCGGKKCQLLNIKSGVVVIIQTMIIVSVSNLQFMGKYIDHETRRSYFPFLIDRPFCIAQFDFNLQ